MSLEWNCNALVWNKVAQVKVSMFAWHVLANRIPTRENLLIRRGILNFDAQQCVLGCGLSESLSHLLFFCNLSHKVCCDVLPWLGVQSTLHNNQVIHAQ
ncbi:unnamed protein product [Trifolium pratense]|uniref:Uncharacterized protein n=1 Tax=Trifolium pratense TaxID=57577 RepID=A0ACB0LDZ5_TRIPR|nr:unnamed protein product [Trifolium pratense]